MVRPEGLIEDIGFRVTRVPTVDIELVTVPNSELTGTAVINSVAKDCHRGQIAIGIGDDDIEEGRRISRTVADKDSAIL